jgi:hypothetical protein
VRRLLVQVALSTMRLRKAASKPLWEWASRIEAKRGRKVAAVARKTAGILFAMLRDKAPPLIDPPLCADGKPSPQEREQKDEPISRTAAQRLMKTSKTDKNGRLY